MGLPKDDAATLSARWTEGVLFKRDVFSTVERGRFRDDAAGEVDACCAGSTRCRPGRIRSARHLFARERHALTLARDLDVGPKLLWAGRRRWCAASSTASRFIWQNPMATSPIPDPPSSRLRKLHRAGICHNDLAKEQNWLRGSDGRAYVTDFQLAACFKTRKPAVPDRGL